MKERRLADLLLKCRKTRPTFSTADLVTRCIFHQAGLAAAANQIKSSDAQGEFELDLSSAIRTFKGGGGGDAILRGFSQSGWGMLPEYPDTCLHGGVGLHSFGRRQLSEEQKLCLVSCKAIAGRRAVNGGPSLALPVHVGGPRSGGREG